MTGIHALCCSKRFVLHPFTTIPILMKRTLFSGLSAALAVAALSFSPALAAQDAPVAMGDTSIFRPLDLPAPNQYRSASGKPGPSYWQQRANYQIQATLDPATQTIRGTETIRYRNGSPDTLRFVWLQMDQNLYRPDSKGSFLSPGDSRWGARDFQGGYTVAYTRVGGKPVDAYIRDTMHDAAGPVASARARREHGDRGRLVVSHPRARLRLRWGDGTVMAQPEWML